MIEVCGNILNYSDNYIAQCISSDYKLGKGLALTLDDKYKIREKLFEDYSEQLGVYPNCILTDKIFNLVTKDKFHNKPTLNTLGKSLVMMKQQIEELNIKGIVIPELGCGLDKLKLKDVKELINIVFTKTDLEIIMVHYTKE